MATTDLTKKKSCEKVGQLLPGFVRADARNLPKVNIFMIVQYFQDLCHPAMKHIKMKRSAGEDYGDDAVGYVQLRRIAGGSCEVAARVTPEHKVSSCPYRVHAIINEKDGVITEAKCKDCAAAEGHCKHATAFLGWLDRRSSEKAVTSQVSYWKKARLSTVTSETKKVSLKRLRPKERKKNIAYNSAGRFFKEVVDGAPAGMTGLIFDHVGLTSHKGEELGIDNLLHAFLKEQKGTPICANFMNFCSLKMTDQLCEAIRTATTLQSQSPLWHAVRFGRITASKAYGAAHSSGCRKSTLVKLVIGAAKLKDTKAMMRGRELEPRVIKGLRSKIGDICCTGIYLNPKYPLFGASPDGITKDGKSVVEVKCPTNVKSFCRYINKDGTVAAKHLAQLQMLMHMAGKNRAFFCVADPKYELNKNVTIVKVMYDATYTEGLIDKCLKFWEKTVFLELCCAYTK